MAVGRAEWGLAKAQKNRHRKGEIGVPGGQLRRGRPLAHVILEAALVSQGALYLARPGAVGPLATETRPVLCRPPRCW